MVAQDDKVIVGIMMRHGLWWHNNDGDGDSDGDGDGVKMRIVIGEGRGEIAKRLLRFS